MMLSAGGEHSLTVTKAITVLTAISLAPAPLTVSEIIAVTGLGKSATLRFLATLSSHRMIERDEQSGRYRLGTGMIEMAQHALGQHPVLLRAAPVVDEIVRLTGDIALVMVEENGQSLCIHRRVGNSPIATVGSNIGTRSPMHCGAGPFALLAFAPDSFVDSYLERPLEAPTSSSVTEPADIRERIDCARKRGFTIGAEDLFEYVVAIGVPVRDTAGKAIGSISIGGINHRYPMQRCHEVGELLKELTERQQRQ